MKTLVIWVVGVLGVAAVPLVAQSPGTDTLTALLTEVRLLRIAMERSATAPELQLLSTRLAVQNERLQEATRSHAEARNKLQQLLSDVAALTAEAESFEDQAAGSVTMTAQQREAMAQREKQVKSSLTSAAAQEANLRARETELAGALAAEQNQWLLMNQRLDDLERALKLR
jgi:hypothetical protein